MLPPNIHHLHSPCLQIEVGPPGHASLAEDKRPDVTSRPSPVVLAYDASVSINDVLLFAHLSLKKAQEAGIQMLGTKAIYFFYCPSDDL